MATDCVNNDIIATNGINKRNVRIDLTDNILNIGIDSSGSIIIGQSVSKNNNNNNDDRNEQINPKLAKPIRPNDQTSITSIHNNDPIDENHKQTSYLII